MTDKGTLDQIADEIGDITDEQTDGESEESSREGDEFDVDDFKRTKDGYDGGW